MKNPRMLTLIPLIAGLIVSAPLSQLHARGDRGSHPLAENERHHGENHDPNYHEGYEHGYEHGYDHGYTHGNNRGDNWGDPAVGVGVGVGLGEGAGTGAGVYVEPAQPVYYSPEPGVNIHFGN